MQADRKTFWTQEKLTTAKNVLKESYAVRDATERLCVYFGVKITEDMLTSAFRRQGLGRPSDLLCKLPAMEASAASARLETGPGSGTGQAKEDLLVELLDLAKRGVSFEDVCNKLDISPAKLRGLLDRAKAEGFALQIGVGHIKLGYDDSYWGEDQSLDIEPTVGGWFKVGVLSDLHAGSKYTLTRQTEDCVERMHRAGVRDILVPGDLLDGCYKHGVFELRQSGIADQTRALSNTLPHLEGLNYHCITGNHDFTFAESTGLNVGQYIEGYFRDCGRRDIHFYGDRAATLSVGNTKVRLLHPTGSCSYAISYKLQKFVEAFDSGEKPGILLVGHYHRSCYIYTRGVHAIACPTFQGPGSAFGKSLGLGPQAIGGLMLKWRVTRHHTIRDLVLRPMNYFKHEQPKELVR